MKRELKTGNSPTREKIVLSPEDSSLDAWMLCTYNRRLPFVERKIASLPEDNESQVANKRLLQKCLDRVKGAHAKQNFEVLIPSMDALMYGLKAAVFLIPLAEIGEKFKSGRKPGAVGPVRKAIRSLLKKKPGMKNPEIWEHLKSNPPRGWVFYDNRIGEYIEYPGGETKRAQFNNICGEERKNRG